MANILIRLDGVKEDPLDLNGATERMAITPRGKCWIYGKKNTFSFVREGEDAIVALGYVCHMDCGSLQETLSQILQTFQELQIGDLKKKLIGQYVLLIKKDRNIYLFSDFFGGRNIFYTDDGRVISSSFSQIENLIQTSPADLNMSKVFEFLAMRHIFYPTWIGRETQHKRIQWLLPYEYLVIDAGDSSVRRGSVIYEIDNHKQADCSLLSDELLSILKAIVHRGEFKDAPLAASLTGGRDSRLVAVVATEQYPHIHFRTAAEGFNSLKDLKVARKIAKARGVSLDVYEFQPGRDEERFRELTEGFSSSLNQGMAPLIEATGSYALGFGGIFGTELFLPMPWNSIDDFIRLKMEGAKKALRADAGFWNDFQQSLYEEFRQIKEHFRLALDDERDYIRIFIIINTARFGSFIISSFNRSGYQLEPYGSYAVFDLALRVAPSLWGNHKKLRGNAWIQKAAMAKLDPRSAKIMTYSSFRPMSPFSSRTSPRYVLGFAIQVSYWLRERFLAVKKGFVRTDLPRGYYLSNGWEASFLGRTKEKYGMSAASPENVP